MIGGLKSCQGAALFTIPRVRLRRRGRKKWCAVEPKTGRLAKGWLKNAGWYRQAAFQGRQEPLSAPKLRNPKMTNSRSREAPPAVGCFTHEMQLRVRYSETDQMGTVYNSRPLEWFECGRTEMLRSLGLPYADLESRGVFLPLIEAQLQYAGRARYDDLLRMTTVLSFVGRARVRCQVKVVHAQSGKEVVRGYTVHAFTDAVGKPIRPPAWILEKLTPK
jgi:acyl-CoA thioester hydrolase